MCLRAWWEGERALETRLCGATRARSLSDAWARWDAKPRMEMPAPKRRDYAGLGEARRIVIAMTRRSAHERLVPLSGLQALLDALPTAASPVQAIHTAHPANGNT